MRSVPSKIRTLGCEVDPLTMSEAVELVTAWLDELKNTPHESLPPCRYVVTPNLDHAVLLNESPSLRDAYRDATLVLADGMPLVWASRLFRRPLPERVAGSDLTPAVFRAARPGTKVFLLGAMEESSVRATENIRRDFPHLDVVGRLSPPLGFETSPEWSDQIVSQIKESQAALVLVGFGAPKQEIWVHRHRERLQKTIVLCAGATIDFLAGTVHRAPGWAQTLGAEWIHRMLSDPRRLARRYAKDALYLPALLLKDAWSEWPKNGRPRR